MKSHLLVICLYHKLKSKISCFVQFCSYYGKFIYKFSDCAAPLTSLFYRNLPNNVVHGEATKAAFENLKARMISAPKLLIPKA